MSRRLGLFGGTFDPPHHGHLIVAAEAWNALKLEKVIFIPAAFPPHKRTVATAASLRLRMVRAAIQGDPRFDVDAVELERGGTSYTVDTLRELKGREPDAELVFLLGIDQFRKFSTWKEPGEVSRLAELVVISRAGEHADLSSGYRATGMQVSRIDISATAIREWVAKGLSPRYFVPEPVREIIEQEHLYRAPE